MIVAVMDGCQLTMRDGVRRTSSQPGREQVNAQLRAQQPRINEIPFRAAGWSSRASFRELVGWNGTPETKRRHMSVAWTSALRLCGSSSMTPAHRQRLMALVPLHEMAVCAGVSISRTTEDRSRCGCHTRRTESSLWPRAAEWARAGRSRAFLFSWESSVFVPRRHATRQLVTSHKRQYILPSL